MGGTVLAFVGLVTDEILISVETLCDIDDNEDEVEFKDPLGIGDAVSEVVGELEGVGLAGTAGGTGIDWTGACDEAVDGGVPVELVVDGTSSEALVEILAKRAMSLVISSNTIAHRTLNLDSIRYDSEARDHL